MKVARWTCFGYWAVLTAGLLHPKGASASGLSLGGWLGSPRVDHFFAFAVLAVLAQAARFPLGLMALSGILSAYAVCTELAQAAIPNRTPALLDVLSDLAGLAVGTIAWRVAAHRGVRQSQGGDGAARQPFA